MSTVTVTRDTLAAALRAKGLQVADQWGDPITTPFVVLEPGDPWIERSAMSPGAGKVHWRIVCVADKGGSAPTLTTELASTALVAYHVLAALLGWSTSNVSGLRVIPETAGNYVAVELSTSTPIDITEGT